MGEPGASRQGLLAWGAWNVEVLCRFMSDALCSIQLAARLTGLSEHVIRIWEQRYRAVEPGRTPSHRRLYGPEDLRRLQLLRDLTRAGHRIGQVARLSTKDLGRIAQVPQRLRQVHAAWLPRWAQPVVRFSIQLNSSYMAIAMAPMVTRPAKASGMRCWLPAVCIR